MQPAEDSIPRWGALPNATVALVLLGVGLSGRTTAWRSVVLVALGAVYARDVGLFLRRPPRKRGRRFLLVRRLLRPLVVPPLRALLWVAGRGYLLTFKRDHRWLLQPDARHLLQLRERAKNGDVWVLSNEAVYIGRKAADRRLSRTRRADVVELSHSEMGGLHVVTLTVHGDEAQRSVVTGCFSEAVYGRHVRRLVKELSPPNGY